MKKKVLGKDFGRERSKRFFYKKCKTPEKEISKNMY